MHEPIDSPDTCARSMPSSSISDAVSSAISRVDTSPSPLPDLPVPRLSNRTQSYRFRYSATCPSQHPRSSPVPMISTSGGPSPSRS